MTNIKIISAGAGSGKTYRLTQEMVAFLNPPQKGEKADQDTIAATFAGKVRPSGIIATTFTNKAAAELQERVRVKLLENGLADAANDLTNALIGTVHGLGVKLLKRFAFEAGVSPEVDIIADEDQQVFFNQALANVLTTDLILEMDKLSSRLGLNKKDSFDWRREVKRLSDLARNNAFDAEALKMSEQKSIETLLAFFPNPSHKTAEEFNTQLQSLLSTTLLELRDNDDKTKTTQSVVNTLQEMLNNLKSRGYLNWHEWVKISKVKPGKKSKDAAENLRLFAERVETHPQLRLDIQAFISKIFEIAQRAIIEYNDYKRRRGLIDYIDMEVSVNELLNQSTVQHILSEELDLLMVDEFQDTSPIQLEIFLKLARLAKISVWVGDPKQSIYGFRGAEPALMEAVIATLGGVSDTLEFSWRSRQDIVHATNAIFTKAFTDLPDDRIVLTPRNNKQEDPIHQDLALVHWHYEYDGKSNRAQGKPWLENAIARSIRQAIEEEWQYVPKGKKETRPLRAGDVAVLCRSNADCQTMAEALHRAGLKAAISRSGMLQTPEAKLILAALKYILDDRDALSVAEMLALAVGKSLEEVVEHRIKFLASEQPAYKWAAEIDFIKNLKDLRKNISELSSSEILNLLLETTDLRRVVIAWGNPEQRLSNVDQFVKFALQYEEACNRLHTAASLGGFLLWLSELEVSGADAQGSGESEDAVNVLTYHKSKGLEWPLVICHSLERKLQDNVWGISIENASEALDINNVLGGRWIKYWINPYADQIRNTPLERRVNESPNKKLATANARQEEARLLYVGITRARDYLAFPSRKTPTRWLNRCWSNDEDMPTLDPNYPETPWVYAGEVLPKQTTISTYPKIFETIPLDADKIEYFEARAGEKAHRSYWIDIDNDDFSKELDLKILKTISYHRMPIIHELVDEYNVAKAIKAWVAADDWNTTPLKDTEKETLAAGIIERLGENTEHLPTKVILQNAKALHQHFYARFEVIQIIKKYPVFYPYNGRAFENVIDILIETKGGWIIIQHSSSRDTKQKWNSKVRDLYPWFYFAECAIRDAFAIPASVPVRCFLNFVLHGSMVELAVVQRPQQQLSLL